MLNFFKKKNLLAKDLEKRSLAEFNSTVEEAEEIAEKLLKKEKLLKLGLTSSIDVKVESSYKHTLNLTYKEVKKKYPNYTFISHYVLDDFLKNNSDYIIESATNYTGEIPSDKLKDIENVRLDKSDITILQCDHSYGNWYVSDVSYSSIESLMYDSSYYKKTLEKELYDDKGSFISSSNLEKHVYLYKDTLPKHGAYYKIQQNKYFLAPSNLFGLDNISIERKNKIANLLDKEISNYNSALLYKIKEGYILITSWIII